MRIAIETPGQEAYETLNERLVDFNRTKVNWGTAAFTVVLRDEIGSTTVKAAVPQFTFVRLKSTRRSFSVS